MPVHGFDSKASSADFQNSLRPVDDRSVIEFPRVFDCDPEECAKSSQRSPTQLGAPALTPIASAASTATPAIAAVARGVGESHRGLPQERASREIASWNAAMPAQTTTAIASRS